MVASVQSNPWTGHLSAGTKCAKHSEMILEGQNYEVSLLCQQLSKLPCESSFNYVNINTIPSPYR